MTLTLSVSRRVRADRLRATQAQTAGPPIAPPGGGSVHDINHFAQLVLDQAMTLYRYWPDVEGRLFE